MTGIEDIRWSKKKLKMIVSTVGKINGRPKWRYFEDLVRRKGSAWMIKASQRETRRYVVEDYSTTPCCGWKRVRSVL